MTSPEPPEKTFNMRPSSQRLPDPYSPLRFSEDSPDGNRVRRIAQQLLNLYANKEMTIREWRSAGAFSVHWTHQGRAPLATPMTFAGLCSLLRQRRRFAADAAGLPPLHKNWMDGSVAMAMPFHAPCNEDDSHLTIRLASSISEGFPVSAALDREGVGYSSVQLYLQRTILRSRAEAVDSSNLMFEVAGDQWLASLLAYLNAATSTVETTLNQLYYKAKYESAAWGWKFDEARLGPTRVARLACKLAWVGLITGRPLDNARDETKGFSRLKAVRNHFHHFDPPLMAYTIEDVADWLNLMDSVAMLLWKVREKLRVPLSEPLIAMLLAPKVEFVPRDPGRRRAPQPAHVGHASCTWPKR